MNIACLNAIIGLTLALVFIAPLRAEEASPLGVTASNWPGVNIEVMRILRVAPERLLLVVRVRIGSDAENPTFLGFLKPPAKVIPEEEKKSSGGTRSAPSGNRTDQTGKILLPPSSTGQQFDPHFELLPPQADPFSLKESILVDTGTRKKFPALPDLPSSPSFGPNTVTTTMRPGEWLQMAVQFPAPPVPPSDASGKVPEQKISVFFPNANLPVKDLVLPPPSIP